MSMQSRLSEDPPPEGFQYREHDRMAALSDKPQVIGAFLDWLATQRMEVCQYHGEVQAQHAVWESDDAENNDEEPWVYKGDRVPVYLPVRLGTEDLLYKYFGLSRKLINIEKDLMLKQIRQTRRDG